MTRGRWIKLDVGLLDDNGWNLASPAAKAAWVTAYLLQARRGGDLFAGIPELRALLRKEGIPDAGVAIDELLLGGMLEHDGPDSPRLGVTKYAVYQSRYRGPSDDPEYKAAYMREHRRATVGLPRLPRGTEEKRGEEKPRARARGVDEAAVRPQVVHRDGGPSKIDEFPHFKVKPDASNGGG